MHKPNIFISFDYLGIKDYKEYSDYLSERIEKHQCARDAFLVTKAKSDSMMRILPKPKSIAYNIEKLRTERQTNSVFGKAARDMAIAYLVTLNEEYALKAKEILLSFPENIDAKKEVNKIEKINKHHLTYCDDWIPKMIFVYDALREYFDGNESDKILKFFDDSADVIKRDSDFEYWRDHNRGTWHQSALGLIGLVTGSREYVSKASQRIKTQMEEFLPLDCIWWEGSAHIHFFYLYAITNFLIGAAHNGLDLPYYKNSRGHGIKNLFDSPLQLANPEGTIPANNDRGHRSIFSPNYEIGYYLYKDKAYLPIIEKLHARDFRNEGKPDETVADTMLEEAASLIYGTDIEAKKGDFTSQSTIYHDSGWGILKSIKLGEKYIGGNSLYAFLDFGPHGGSHGHADKLNLYLYGNKTEFTRDERWFNTFETLIGGVNIHTAWTKKSLSHNTLMIDEQGQIGADSLFDENGASGELEFFYEDDEIKVIKADAKRAYPNADLNKYSRLVAVTDAYFIDIFEADSEHEHVYDWMFHALADKVALSATKFEQVIPQNELSMKEGYEWLEDLTKTESGKQWQADWSNGLITYMGDACNKLLYTGKALRTFDLYMPFVMDRRRAKSVRFTAVHHIKGYSQVNDIKIADDAYFTAIKIKREKYTDFFVYRHTDTPKKTWVYRVDGITVEGKGIFTYKRI